MSQPQSVPYRSDLVLRSAFSGAPTDKDTGRRKRKLKQALRRADVDYNRISVHRSAGAKPTVDALRGALEGEESEMMGVDVSVGFHINYGDIRRTFSAVDRIFTSMLGFGGHDLKLQYVFAHEI